MASAAPLEFGLFRYNVLISPLDGGEWRVTILVHDYWTSKVLRRSEFEHVDDLAQVELVVGEEIGRDQEKYAQPDPERSETAT